MARTDVGQLLEMINGYQQTCLLVAGIQVGLFEALAGGPVTIADLASALPADERNLARLVRALKLLDVVTQDGVSVSLTGKGRLLLADGMGAGLRAWTELIGGEYLAAWGQLAHSVRTGEVAFEHVFGTSAWQHRQDHPGLNAAFNRVTTGEQVRTISAVTRCYDFAPLAVIADIGGGHGNLVAGILRKHEHARGILFDLPHVVDGAHANLREAGVEERCTAVGGSFLEAVPAGADAYLLKHVLHNWDDRDCVRILANVRAAMAGNAVLLLIEDVLPDDEDAARAVVMLDIHMMAVLGGIERTSDEYAALLGEAGLRLARVISTRPGAPHIIEARCADGADEVG